jgi:hypothetical protein
VLSANHTDAIGRLVVAVSKIDILLTDLVAVFLRGTDLLFVIITLHHQQIANKIDTLKALVKLRTRSQGTNLLHLLSEVKKITEYRNKLVHGYWSVDRHGKIHVARFQTRGEFKRDRQAITADEIRHRAQHADEIADELGAIRDRLYDQ